jgi:prolyl-tRNA editing enzyme YbaK/EbsC (Cys-tRNA(Pro) deacylase)
VTVDDVQIERRVREAVATLADVDVVDCDPALADTAEFCAAYGYELDDSANAIVVIGRQRNADVPPVYAVCIVLASTRLDVNRVVRTRLGVRKASFAPADVTAELTGMTIGGVTPFALPPHLPLWIDERVMQRDRIVVGGGSRRAKVVGPPAMLLTIPGAEVVTDLAQP